MNGTATEQRPTAQRSMWVIGHRVTPIPLDGGVLAVEVATPVGVPGPPPHYHEDCVECFFVTAGRLGVLNDGQWSTLDPGEHVEVPRGVVHTFRNDGEDELRTITGFAPTGFEAFFEEYGVDASQTGAFEASISDDMIRRVVEGCGRFGMVIQDVQGDAQ
jgi:mannose-6-phosphate isomerase-like protein (cupin superfamily)